MTTSTGRGRRMRPDTATHRFAVGQAVRIRNRFGMALDTAEAFRVTRLLPSIDNSPQYRIRNDEERHERVTTEDKLEPLSAPLPEESSTLVERTFRNGQGTETRQS